MQLAALGRRSASLAAGASAASALAMSHRMCGVGGGRPSSALSHHGAVAAASLGRLWYSSTVVDSVSWFRHSGAVAFTPVRAALGGFKWFLVAGYFDIFHHTCGEAITSRVIEIRLPASAENIGFP